MKKTILTLDGLNCAHCAGKIEEKINQLDYLEEVELNFLNKEIRFKIQNNNEIDKAFNEIRGIVNKIEPGVKVDYKQKTKDEHNHELEHNHGEASISKWDLFRFGFGIALFVGAIYTHKIDNDINIILFLISYIAFGYDVILKAIKNIFKGNVFDENFLMCIATIGALGIGEYSEAVAVMLFYQIGEFFQDLAISKSRKSIKALMNIKSEYANLIRDDKTIKVSPEEVKIEDIILVKPGEKIPLDGEIIEGNSLVDMSALIGEAEPREVFVGEKVLSGGVNLNGILKIKVESEFENSTVAKILEMVENAGSRKSKAENFITKFAKIYTPIVVACAILIAVIPPFVIEGAVFGDWFRRALVFLVSSCPCALIVSIPLGFFSGIGAASKKGVLIKGSNYVQALSEINTVVFDKTGTITKGVFAVNGINADDEEKVLRYAYALEKYSNHPVGQAIKAYFENSGLEDNILITDFEEISGFGLKGYFNGNKILVGNDKLLIKENIKFDRCVENGTVIYAAENNNFLGYITAADIIKDDSKTAVRVLKSIGIKKTVMLTGDREQAAKAVAEEVGVDEYYSQLLPQDKVTRVEELYGNNADSKIAFIGDGINDAPVLARADVGVAMGGIGSDAAIEAADVVIMNDELSKLAIGIIIARNTIKIVKQNIAFVIAIKLIVLALAAVGFASMWLAVFADVGVALLAVLNSMRKKD